MITIEAFAFAAIMLSKGYRETWIISYFFLLGVGALFGGTSHGFKEYITPKREKIAWKGTLILLALTSFSLIFGITRLLLPQISAIVGWIFGLALIPYFYRVWTNGQFFDAVVYYGIAMLSAMGICIYSLLTDQVNGVIEIIWGFIVLAVGTVIQVKKIGFHKHFNHNDIFHVFSMVATWLLFTGLYSI